MTGHFPCMWMHSGSLGQLIFFYFVGMHFFGLKVKPPYFNQILLKILQNLHHFAVHFAADTLTLSK